jgi:hypothetical protein
MTDGIQPFLEIYDGATGEKANSSEYHGQGQELFWTSGNQLASWDNERLHLVESAALTYPGAVDLTIAPGVEECPTGPFNGVLFDRASNARFAADFHDTGTIVCRVDISTATITSTIIEGPGGPSQAFLRPETGEVVVAYSAESIADTDSVAVLDAATLDVKSSEPTSTGLPVSAATATDFVVGLDRATDSFASTGQPIAALATGDRFGSYLFGVDQAFTLVLMDQTSGQALFLQAEAAFRPVAGTADGSKIVFLLAESHDFSALG